VAEGSRFLGTPLGPSFKIVVEEKQPENQLSDKELETIEKIWQEQKSLRGDALFNGQLLSFVKYEQDCLVGRFVEYKHYIAQYINSSLRPVLHIEPVTINGLTIASGKLLIGKRSSLVTNYPGRLELVPSGVIDDKYLVNSQIDYVSQALNELAEEADLTKKDVENVSAFSLVHDHGAGNYEICVLVSVKQSAIEKLPEQTSEYEMLAWWCRDEVLQAISDQQDFVPLSLHIIDQKL
jgi:hypothetical protein